MTIAILCFVAVGKGVVPYTQIALQNGEVYILISTAKFSDNEKTQEYASIVKNIRGGLRAFRSKCAPPQTFVFRGKDSQLKDIFEPFLSPDDKEANGDYPVGSFTNSFK